MTTPDTAPDSESQAQAQAQPQAQLDRIARLPCWQGSANVAVLGGGMTNHNFRVDDRSGTFVVRLGQDLPFHGVMRFNELAVARAAHAAGLSPEVVYAEPGVMVSRWVGGITLTDADIRSSTHFSSVVDLVRRFHKQVPLSLRGPVLTFWVFHVIRHYAATLQSAPRNPLAQRWTDLLALAEQLEKAVGSIDLVLGHNDLLAANFMHDGQRLWLIDFDYAGFNSPLFDLANLSTNNGFSPEQDQAMLHQYFADAAKVSASTVAFQAMKLASLLREVMWGAVSDVTSTIDFDYAGYTHGYLARLDDQLLLQQPSQGG
jgi:thiamine kinase-like enzyme